MTGSRALVLLVRAKGGKFVKALIDADRFAELSERKWQLGRDGYAVRNYWVSGRQFKLSLHVAVAGSREGLMLDHINGNKLDNRACNLRHVTATQNSVNRGPRPGSRFKGITLHKSRGKWQAVIKSGGRQFYLGLFETDVDAAKAYDQAARIYHGEFARLNFPDGASL